MNKYFHFCLWLSLVCWSFICGSIYEAKLQHEKWRQPTTQEAASLFHFGPDPFNDGINKAGQRWGWLTDGKGSWMYKQLPGKVETRQTDHGLEVILSRE